MFHPIRRSILERMQELQEIENQRREAGAPYAQLLRQITPDTGKFLALLMANAPQGVVLEIGTSAGYSTLWLALACEASGRTLTTFEVLPEKAVLARETFAAAAVEGVVRLVEGDARHRLTQYEDIAFCFLDADKDVYAACYEAVIPRLVRGGWLVADNAVSHREYLQPLLDRALSDERVDAVIVPIGKGELVCHKV